MVTWAALLAAMAGVYLLEGPRLMNRVSGGLHEFVFLAYALVTALIAVDQRPRRLAAEECTACGG